MTREKASCPCLAWPWPWVAKQMAAPRLSESPTEQRMTLPHSPSPLETLGEELEAEDPLRGLVSAIGSLVLVMVVVVMLVMVTRMRRALRYGVGVGPQPESS